jgi:hypothetical protein
MKSKEVCFDDAQVHWGCEGKTLAMAPRQLIHAWTVLGHFAGWMKPEMTRGEALEPVEKFLFEADQTGKLLERWRAFNRSGYDLEYEEMAKQLKSAAN